MNVFGKEWKREELMSRIGDLSQIGGARLSVLTEGRAEGTRIIDVKTGGGLAFTAVPSRCLDLAQFSYKGIPLSFISKTGMVGPQHYETDYDGFHRSFFAGMLTTCGLRNTGAGNVHEGEYLGLHGRISNTAAYNTCISQNWKEDECEIIISGKMRESKLYGENLLLDRTIWTYMGSSRVRITDVVTNEGFHPEGVAILYHCNIGFPLLDTCTKITLSEGTAEPRDSRAAEVIESRNRVEEPLGEYPETVFFHKLTADEDGYAHVSVFNPEIGEKGIGLRISYRKNTLPYLIQWKNMMKGDYVMAFEPSNCYPIGRNETAKKGMLKMLGPGESVTFDLTLEAYEEDRA